MVRAWYMDDEPGDQQEEHHKSPPEFITMKRLYYVTGAGVEYMQLDLDTLDSDGILEHIKKQRGYTSEYELICSKECMPNCEEKHLHRGEEVSLVIEGSGYLDVRDKLGRWIRIEVVPGDLLIVPSGIYHRFMLDKKNYIKVRRLFTEYPVWTVHHRVSDTNYMNNAIFHYAIILYVVFLYKLLNG